MEKLMPRFRGLAQRYAQTTRSKRFLRFEELSAGLGRPLRLIDVGGTTDFWEAGGWAGRDDVEITIVNLFLEERRYDNIVPVVGDATNLSEYGDQSFDIAFSNSVIEHLFSPENQHAMAEEMTRVGRSYWVQTPNYWFPIEPHFLLIGWQWLPKSARVAILTRWNCGRYPREIDREKAQETISEIRLLSKRDLKRMLPDGRIEPERFLGLVKSWIVIGGM